MDKEGWKKTQTGKIVYPRKTHFWTLTDVQRIIRQLPEDSQLLLPKEKDNDALDQLLQNLFLDLIERLVRRLAAKNPVFSILLDFVFEGIRQSLNPTNTRPWENPPIDWSEVRA
jgi:hypothetical protein